MHRRTHERAGFASAALIQLLLLASVTLSFFSCFSKDSSFFSLTGLDGDPVEDTTPPVFTMLRPSQPGWVLNDDYIHFRFTDPAGSNGAPPSGIDFNSVSAINNAPLPLTRDGNDFMAGLDVLSPGTHEIQVSGADNAGNTASAQLGFYWDPVPPEISIADPPSGQMEVSDPTFTFGISGIISDPNIAGATAALYRAGADATCGTEDDAMVEAGTGPGQASPNMVDLKIGANGAFSTSFEVQSPLMEGEDQREERLCARVEARDNAVNVDGQPNPNRAVFFIQQYLLWRLAPFTPVVIACSVLLTHGSGESLLRALIATQILAGLPFRAVFTGPEGGLAGDGVHTGTLDSSGGAEILQRIFLFGLYLLSLTITASDGTEHSTSVEIDVGPEEMTYQCAE